MSSYFLALLIHYQQNKELKPYGSLWLDLWHLMYKIRNLAIDKNCAMEPMTTLSRVLEVLKGEGYTTDFNLKDSCLQCTGNTLQIHPEDFVVDRHYRFEGDSDPDDSAIVYAISSVKHGLKGTLVNGYGIYTDELSAEMMRTLHPRNR